MSIKKLFCLLVVSAAWSSAAQPILRNSATTNSIPDAAMLGGISAGSLTNRTTINVLDFGATPYIPPNFGTGSFPTNAVDCSVALSNAFRFASNQPAPRVVFLPNGIYKYTNTLTVPPLTSIEGAGWLHNGMAGGTRVRTAITTIATNNFSVLWYTGNSNGTAMRVPYNHFGHQFFRNFEICGATNAMADLGQTYGDPLSIEMLPDTALSACGINFDCNTYCGGFTVEDCTFSGFQIGVNHAGNSVTYRRCSFNGNDIGFVCTNTWEPDQVLIEQCGIGNRQGGIGYFLRKGNGFVINQPCDIDYYTFAIQAGLNNLTVIGGNSEGNGTVAPSWCLGYSGGSFHKSNFWAGGNAFFEKWAGAGETANDTLTIIGGKWQGGNRACMINDRGWYLSGNSFVDAHIVQPNFVCTNLVDGWPVLYRSVAVAGGYIDYIPSYQGEVMYAQYMNPGTGLPVLTRPIGRNQIAITPRFSTYFNGVISASTNMFNARWGVIEAELDPTFGSDYLQIQLADSYSGVTPTFGRRRLILGDSGMVNGRPNTNITVQNITRPTNAAPTSVTIGTTAPDAWVAETNNGVKMWSPRWINH